MRNLNSKFNSSHCGHEAREWVEVMVITPRLLSLMVDEAGEGIAFVVMEVQYIIDDVHCRQGSSRKARI